MVKVVDSASQRATDMWLNRNLLDILFFPVDCLFGVLSHV